MKNNSSFQGLTWFYKIGFFVILALPLLNFTPVFYPPSWTKSVIMKIVVIILLNILLYQLLFKYKKINLVDIKNNPVFLTFGLFFLVFFLASVFSAGRYVSFWGDPERGGGFVNLLFYGLFGLLFVVLLQKEEWKKMWTFSIGVGAIIAFLSVIAFFGLTPSALNYLNSRTGATLGNPIFLGIYLIMLLFISASLFLTEKGIKKKVFYAISVGIFLSASFLTGSRGAYLGFLAGLFYFLIFYPPHLLSNKKRAASPQRVLKITALAILAIIVSTVFYATYTPTAIPLISENRITKIIIPRLSLNFLVKEERFKTWGTVIEAIKERPILGWGPENLSVGFDKHFDPKKTPLGWWDRSHNTFLDAGATAGIPGLIAYIGLFVVLFWQLYRTKRFEKNADYNTDAMMMAHGIQATLIGYAGANFFGIDSFSSLLIFFLIAAYTASLNTQYSLNIQGSNNTSQPQRIIQNLSISKKRFFFTVFITLSIIFVWQYNVKPFFLNIDLNMVKILAENGLCKESLDKIEKIGLPQKMLGQYGVLEAMESIQYCIRKHPGETAVYSERSLEILEKSLPLYASSNRLWKLAGSVSSTIAVHQKDAVTKNAYLEKSQGYFEKALVLSPKSQEIILSMAHIDILKKDCRSAMERANQCIALDQNSNACYWTRAQSLICAGEFQKAEEDIQLAKELSLEIYLDSSIQQIINAYIAVENYEKIIEYYEFLVKKNDHNVKYRASLAETYRLTGQYQKARETALGIIDRVPKEKKDRAIRDVEAFLQTLPPQYR